MSAIVFVAGILATLKIAYELTSGWKFEGPGGLYTWVRSYFQRESQPDWVRKGIVCPVCVSHWVAFGVALLATMATGSERSAMENIAMWILLGLAFSGAVALFYGYVIGVLHDKDFKEW